MLELVFLILKSTGILTALVIVLGLYTWMLKVRRIQFYEEQGVKIYPGAKTFLGTLTILFDYEKVAK